MYDDQIKRLRECASGECFNCSQYTQTTNASVCQKELMKQAAGAIEDLNKEILALRIDHKVESDHYWDVTCDPEYRECHFEKSEWND